ncbi:PAS domain-containing hybrid sensor histidine kinase/response regulator [Sphingomonas sp. Root710]|uniref:PAS domain-containing hybrid sensor histidine kinase/response regulator n=1 Tax=Sphingomonas sp. Root710 TaxID=1736594 RepID=UPI001F457D7B|nr:PAS domain-containing hybrid sensor histidine kinase/response regulator [Sphingomonas sp. Root710]
MLTREGYDSTSCRDLAAVAGLLDDQVGAVVLTEEALARDRERLRAALDAQPAWSDVPFVVLAARRMGPLPPGQAAVLRIASAVDNFTVLERPLSSVSLISAVSSAMRSRQKQFEMRDRLAEIGAQNAELARNEDKLRESEAKFQAIANSIDHMVWSTLPDGYHDYYNQRWYEFTGVPEGSTDGAAWSGMFHPDDQERAWSRWRHSLETGEPYHIEYRLRHRSGDYRWVLGRAQPVRDDGGRITRWFGTCTDIQEIVEARNVLARSRESLEAMIEERTEALRRANEHLHQSQKMEAVGQLTGGIAHDFNNMLTGIIGSMDIMRRRIAAGRYDQLDRFMDAATTSALRAAGLTQRLLAFSRRQSLDSKPIDINALVDSLGDLLTRTIGEQISLDMRLDPGIPAGVTDANQLESALLNLTINARDAMPEGGTLSVSTRAVRIDAAEAAASADAKPGDYVVVTVADTGAGMPADLLGKVFEPFFTTKPIGQGTGLGLSMVYGFAQQNGGHVAIDSAVGRGTAVSIYLPAAERPGLEEHHAIRALPQGNGQCVLVVEDDPSVRLLIRDVLEEVGYAAIEASDAAEALPILASGRTIDLMISDVGLPGMNGRQLADAARSHRPSLPILFVTGYAEKAAIRADFLGENMSMITKPFSLDDLGEKIGEILAGATLARTG